MAKVDRFVSAVLLPEEPSKGVADELVRRIVPAISRPEAVRRRAYLLQIAGQRFVETARQPPYYQSKSCREVGGQHALDNPSTPQGPLRPQRFERQTMQAPVSEQSQRQHFQISSTEKSHAYRPWIYFRTFLKVSTAVFMTINCLYVGTAIALGTANRLPSAYAHMGQAIYQGVHCGWFEVQPDDWTKCY